MSWTSNGFFRNINICAQLNSETLNSEVVIYQPGTLNSLSMAPDARYSGFITSLRVIVDIQSLPEVSLPTREVGATNQEYADLLRGVDIVAPKKRLNFFLKTSNHSRVRVATVHLYNRRPYYPIDALVYLTDAATLDMASDAMLIVQLEDIGYGLLEQNDFLSFIGSAVEEAENTAPSLQINVYGGGGSGSGKAVTTESGDVVVTEQRDLVVYG